MQLCDANRRAKTPGRDMAWTNFTSLHSLLLERCIVYSIWEFTFLFISFKKTESHSRKTHLETAKVNSGMVGQGLQTNEWNQIEKKEMRWKSQIQIFYFFPVLFNEW